MSWKTQPLALIARIGAGQGAPQRTDEFGVNGSPFVRAGSLERLCAGENEDVLEKIPDSVAERRRMTLYPSGTIIFAKSGMSATLGRVYKLTQPSYIVNHLATVNVDSAVDADFLVHFFRFSPPSRLIKDPAYPSIRLSDISEWEIPLPTFDEQKRISAILDKADVLRRQRIRSLRFTEQLLQAIFLQMFGSETSPYCPRAKLSDHLDFITSGGRGWAKYYSKEGSKFIRSLDVRMNEIDDSQIIRVTPPINAEADRTRIRTGDVLLTITGSLIGRVAPVTEAHSGAFISQHVAILRTHGFQPEFLAWAMSTEEVQRQIQKNQTGQTKPGLNFEQIGRLTIPRPPEALEEKFCRLIEKRRSILTHQRDAHDHAKALFTSLQQRAFRGDLDLSRVHLDMQPGSSTSFDPEVSVSKSMRPDGVAFLVAPETLDSELERLATLIHHEGPMPWSADYFKYRVLGTMPLPFTFDDLMDRVDGVFDGEPPYEEIKDIILDLLGRSGAPPLLSQRFDHTIHDSTNEISGRKQIVFEPVL
jgi:type I restriction enzyme S subunit